MMLYPVASFQSMSVYFVNDQWVVVVKVKASITAFSALLLRLGDFLLLRLVTTK